jgi:hypothetical protein
MLSHAVTRSPAFALIDPHDSRPARRSQRRRSDGLAEAFGHAVAPRALSAWLPVALALLVTLLCAPMHARADDTPPSIMEYALTGFGTGAAVGLGSAYLATGHDFKSNEWRTLGYGLAIGALSGVGVGLVLGAVDAGTSRGAGVGYYMMRDSSYGFSVGALVGGVVGALIWLDDGRGKDVLLGLAWGTVIGAGAGIIIGVIEGAARGRSREAANNHRNFEFGLGFTPTTSGAPLPYPNISARF